MDGLGLCEPESFCDFGCADQQRGIDFAAHRHTLEPVLKRSADLRVHTHVCKLDYDCHMSATGMSKPPANKGKRYPVEILTPDEVKALIRACPESTATGIRNRALITLLYRTGLRCSEALQLIPKDVDRWMGAVSVLHGKGDRRRTVGIDGGALEVLEEWNVQRAALGVNGHAPLFCSLKGRPLAGSYVRTLLPRLAEAAGIAKRVHPHGLRHTHAFELLHEGVPLPIIQRQLGHLSLQTTDTYLSHFAPIDVINRIRERQWSV